MNGVNSSNDDVAECPLCMEPLEVDDLNFYPCTCGYQICRFCWHRIRTDANELCPACRKEYPENPADFTPLSQEEMVAFKSQKRQRDQQRKQKITENRKHLSNVRVVQKNLVFVVGLPPRLADADILKKHEYFGKYGKIHKVVINPSTTYAGIQGPSASAYVTYVNNSDALRAIQSVNNVMIDGRLIKTSLGTTKYCSHFMKNQQCPKLDCMYLHELGDPEASFTKEEMHQGKHQEYEKRLHDALIANSGAGQATSLGQASSSNGSMVSVGNGSSVNLATSKSGDSKAQNGSVSASSSSVSSAMSSSSSSSSSASGGTAPAVGAAGAATQQKDAWPSLSVSPVNSKEVVTVGNSSGKNKKEKPKHEKAKSEKNAKAKNNKNNHNQNSNTSSSGSSNVTNKENNHPHNSSTKEVNALPSSMVESTTEQNYSSNFIKSKSERIKEKSLLNRNNKDQQKEKRAISADEEVKLIENSEMIRSGNSNNKGDISSSSSNINNELDNANSDENAAKNDDQRSLSSSSNISSSSSSNGSSATNNSDALSISESASGKSSPGSFPECNLTSDKLSFNSEQQTAAALDISNINGNEHSNHQQPINAATVNSNSIINGDLLATLENLADNKNERINSELTDSDLQLPNGNAGNMMDTSAALSKLNIFDDSNSFFSSAASFQQSLLLRNKMGSEARQNQMNIVAASHLPDLLNGIDGHQNNTNSNEWGEAFKNAMYNKQMEQQQMQQHQLHHQQQHFQQQEEFLRMQELQKRNSLLNNIGFSQINAPHNNEFANSFQGSGDISRLSQAALLQQQQLLQQQAAHSTDHLLNNSLFGTSMSKFFDFHKNQQQQLHQQQFVINGPTSGATNNPLSDHLRMASLLENNRFNSQFLDPSNGLLNPQQQQQKQRLLNKFDPMVKITENALPNFDLNNIINQQLPQPQQQQPQQQQQQQQQAQSQNQPQQTHLNRIANQFSQSVSVDDDLGFDPFIETQKGLAELMENEVVQQQNTSAGANASNATPLAPKVIHQQQQHQQHLMDNMQRARMPPPGFNHMNAFGFGVPRAQSNTSKVLPFMNIDGNGTAANGQPTQQQQQQMQMPNSWNSHLPTFQQQQQSLSESQMHQMSQNGGPPNGGNHKSFNSNDWTAMDPAILSFRQFSSFPQQQQIPPHPQQQQQDMFIQHLTHQHQQNNQAGFGSQPQQLQGGVNLSNGLLNSQQTSQPQVNFSHTNWLNSEQSLFMNSLANGFANNNFDKFSTSMPPGMHQSNLNLNKQQQKAECIN